MRFFVGFDGGWTKTALALCDSDGRLLADLRGPGTAVFGPPTDQFFAVADALLVELCATAGIARSDIEHAVIGLSGVDFADELPAQHDAIADGLAIEASRLTLVNDGVAAIWGASTETRVTLVQHGSGITMACRKALGDEQVFDSIDIGAVFDIRREAVICVARMIDGRREPTGLVDRVLESCGVQAEQFAEWVARRPEAKPRIALLADVVFDAWRTGDPAAVDLVHRAAADYVLATRAMAARTIAPGQDLAAAFGGGVIAAGGEELQQLLAVLLADACPQARLVPVALPPAMGALVLAGHRTGLAPPDLFDRLVGQRGQP